MIILNGLRVIEDKIRKKRTWGETKITSSWQDQGCINSKLCEANPREIIFSSSLQGIRVTEDWSYWGVTVLWNFILNELLDESG